MKVALHNQLPAAASRRGLLLGGLGAGSALAATRLAPSADARSAARPGDDGGRQSPIDIRTDRAVRSPSAASLVVDYPDRTDIELAYVHKDGDAGCDRRRVDETVEADPGERAVVRRDGEVYRLVQTHFHVSSEHRVDGRRFAMEQHFVHERVSDGRLLVIGVFLVPGGHGPQDRLLRELPEECDEESLGLRGIDVSRMLPDSLTGWTYRGSLTTPPHTQGVIWHVVREPKQIEAATIRRFERLFTQGDSRPPQPRNGRSVRLVRGRRA